MVRMHLLAFLAVVASGCIAGEKPNVVLILADDLGYGDLGCYGQRRIQTPRLDRMAAEGMRFTQFYAGSTVCAPSRCCLMTGLHSGHARIRGNGQVPLRPEDVTVAELLKQAGYTTGIVGKWGLGDEGTTGIPNRQGFDDWFGYPNQTLAHNYYPLFLWNNEGKYFLDGNRDGRRGQYSHDLFTERALRFIADNRDRPFFLYLAYTVPHANNELGQKTGDGMEVPDYGPYAGRDWPNPEKGRAAMVTRMDRDVGRLLDRLRELGLERKTMVLFTSDNGPHKEGGSHPEFFDSNGPLRGIKRHLYDGGIRVPMIARWPGRIPAERVSNQVWAAWDFLPTAAEAAGVRPPAGLDGISMWTTLIGGKQKGHEFLYWEFHERGFIQAVRMGDWKAVRRAGNAMELYDLSNDLGEENDVAGQHPEVTTLVQEYLKGVRTHSDHWPVK